jgi:hypothetical protein
MLCRGACTGTARQAHHEGYVGFAAEHEAHFAPCITNCSIEITTKSLNWISPIGRMPVMAAPITAPAMPASEMGVSMIRLGPNSSIKPAVTPKAPPYTPMSSQ